MPWNNFKKEHDRWLPAVVACLVLVGGALWAGSFLPAPTKRESPPAVAQTTATTVFPRQILRNFDGKVARFTGDAAQPDEIYDVPVTSLPDEVQQQLLAGIVVANEQELLDWIENLTS